LPLLAGPGGRPPEQMIRHLMPVHGRSGPLQIRAPGRIPDTPVRSPAWTRTMRSWPHSGRDIRMADLAGRPLPRRPLVVRPAAGPDPARAQCRPPRAPERAHRGRGGRL